MWSSADRSTATYAEAAGRLAAGESLVLATDLTSGAKRLLSAEEPGDLGPLAREVLRTRTPMVSEIGPARDQAPRPVFLEPLGIDPAS